MGGCVAYHYPPNWAVFLTEPVYHITKTPLDSVFPQRDAFPLFVVPRFQLPASFRVSGQFAVPLQRRLVRSIYESRQACAAHTKLIAVELHRRGRLHFHLKRDAVVPRW